MGETFSGKPKFLPPPEPSPPHPASAYGVSKLASEYYLDYYRQTYGIGYAALRYGNVYGPRQNPFGEAGVIAIFSQKLLSGNQPLINGDGKQTRDFVYVSDVVNANEKALKVTSALTVNISSGTSTDINTIFAKLTKLTQHHLHARHGKAKLGEQTHSVLDIKKAARQLAWHPRISLDEGLAKTLAYFKNI